MLRSGTKRNKQRIGVIDDDPSIRETLTAYLEIEGYEVCSAPDADGLDRMMRSKSPDLVLLDIRLPGRDGLTLTRELREKSEIGIILIAGRNDKVDRILGLEYGADDYIAKPIDERELLPRVRNLLRRVGHCHAGHGARAIKFANFILDVRRRSLRNNAGDEIALTTAEFDLLHVFARNSGNVMSREQLIAAVTHRRSSPMDRTIDTLVRRLRRKIELDADMPKIITTVHGAGYMFVD